ncbi:MAG: hypothetical protein LC734_05185 [Acidobacteria bacterium]|nr:hypothetical protein [Acidobacteriota bacterium]
MKRTFSFLFIIVLFAFEIAGQVAEPVWPGVTEIYLAKDNGSGKAGRASIEFLSTDVPIYCVVELAAAQIVTVKLHLVAVSVPGVRAETHIVTTVYKTGDNENRVNFSGRPAGRWVPGKYRADIFIDGAAAGSRVFTVLQGPLAPKQEVETITGEKPRPKMRKAKS